MVRKKVNEEKKSAHKDFCSYFYFLHRLNKFKVAPWAAEDYTSDAQRQLDKYSVVLYCYRKNELFRSIISEPMKKLSVKSKSTLHLLQIEYFGLSFLGCQRGCNGPLEDDTTVGLTLTVALPVFHLLYRIQHFCGGLAFVGFRRQWLTPSSSPVLCTHGSWHALF